MQHQAVVVNQSPGLSKLDPVDQPVDDGHEDDVGHFPPTEPDRVVFFEELVDNLSPEEHGRGEDSWNNHTPRTQKLRDGNDREVLNQR